MEGKAEPLEAYRLQGLGTDRRMSDQTNNPREDDRNEEIDESPVPDPDEKGDAQDDPEAD